MIMCVLSSVLHLFPLSIGVVNNNNNNNLYWHIKKILHTQKHDYKKTEPIKHKTTEWGDTRLHPPVNTLKT